MLDDEERGVSRKKEKMEKMEKVEKKETELSFHEESEILLKDFMEKKNVREGLSDTLPLYFKMKSKFFIPI